MTLESRIISLLKARRWKLAAAESVTGGAVASRLVSVPGSSEVLECAWVVYSNRSKVKMLGVSEETLRRKGAVSRDCALEMVRAVLRRSGCQAAVATTGIAGPSGGTPAKPVGLTFIAWAGPGFEECQRYQFRCGRNRNRMLATHEVLKGLVRRAEACNATSTK